VRRVWRMTTENPYQSLKPSPNLDHPPNPSTETNVPPPRDPAIPGIRLFFLVAGSLVGFVLFGIIPMAALYPFGPFSFRAAAVGAVVGMLIADGILAMMRCSNSKTNRSC
ncbi:hypothetical protein, partial [Novipirellula herctigrandis]